MSGVALKQRLGVSLKDWTLLEQALTHRSYLNENRQWPLEHNERLEFLGDTVLELVISNHLFRTYPQFQEGELTQLRAKLVCNEVLARVAEKFNVWESMYLSNGERKSGGRARDRIMACAIEAIIGAVYLDQGLRTVSSFIMKHVLQDIDEALLGSKDGKSELQEKAQAIEKTTPTYQVLEDNGPDHERNYIVGVFLGSTMIATGYGLTKKLAEEEAAKSALKTRGW
jgi:ribonuclease III